MHDHGHGRSDHDCGDHHDHHGDQRDGGDSRGGREGGGGGDTRFLQLEMSRVLASEAESITRQAFRELLLEAAKERWRERFGEQITALANDAVDELLEDVEASLDIEARIQAHQEKRAQGRDGREGVFSSGRGGGQQPPPSAPAAGERRAAARRRGKR